MTTVLQLVGSAFLLLLAAAYLWLWLRCLADLAWTAILRPQLTLLSLFGLFALLCVAAAGLLCLGPWAIAGLAVILLPVTGLWTVNILAWKIAIDRFRRDKRGAVITSQPNRDRPLARWSGWLAKPWARYLRAAPLWMGLRRMIWAGPAYAIQHRLAEISTNYERPPVDSD